MSERATALSISTFTLDGTSFLADWRSLGANVQIQTTDGRGGSERYVKTVETKRSSEFTFTVELNTAAATTTEATSLSVSTFLAGAIDLKDDFNSYTITYNSPTRDGSGGRNRDEYANYVGGCDIVVAGDFLIDNTETAWPAMVAALSATPGDRALSLSSNTGAFTLTMDSRLTQCNWVAERGELQVYNLAFANVGAPTAPTGSGLLGKILTGTGTDSLLSLAISSGVGDYAVVEACVTQCVVSISGGEIQTVTGTLRTKGAPTFAAAP